MASASTSLNETEARLIAPAWHTAVVLVALLGFSAFSMWTGSKTSSDKVGPHARVVSYVMIMLWEWLMVAFIGWGVRRRGVRIRDLIAGSWPRWTAALRDLGIAVLFLIGANVILGIVRYALKATPNQALRNIIPQTPTEIGLWMLLALTAGFCEEVIFRGYLQKQLGLMTRSVAAGLVLQGVVFGAAHGYQGAKFMLTIAVYGCMFGWLAYRRRSLRPGMIAHFLQDSVTALVVRHFMK
ncbi:MAG TPA: CPBP family intramembrane glutamic endopeptidase [Terriglobales bacterium]|jgi:membrane protease YdiL (CAAX protease family)|nr:CPBP family intramembrane glutamic endopeptidase [Terriglobales bacterium]